MGTRDPRVDDYIAKSAEFARPVLSHLRDVVHSACPDVEETMKWSFPHFEYEGLLCSMASFKQHCAFGFWKGSLIVDQNGKSVEEAMGQFGRITSISELPSKKLLSRYVKEAMRLNEQGVKSPTRAKPRGKTAEATVPPYFAAALEKNKKALASFEGFSPSNRREYVEWITDAKGDDTRQRRLETAIEWMAEGKTRNWKYMKLASRALPLLIAAALLGVEPVGAQDAARAAESPGQGSTIAIIPQPVRVTPGTGHFRITPRTVIWTDRASVALGRQLARYLEPATGFSLAVRTGAAPPPGAIVLRRDATLRRLGAEGYLLDVRGGRVTARAPEAGGLFYAMQTMRQLLPPEIFREAPIPGVTWTMPAVSIEDHPRFQWRGAHLDVARHFMPKEFVKKYIDLLALHKLNTFHWHLTEDQGWRLEIMKYPRLTEVGAWRRETLVGRQQGQRDTTQWMFDGEPHGGYYTQADAREIVAYGKARFVEVVPEIEMPGHSVAAIAAYPGLGVTSQPIEVARRWGVFDDILNAEPTTVAFMQDVLLEVLEIFPSRFIHIGGDEADKTKWKASPRIQERIAELGLRDEHELQSWFIRQMDAFLTARGRRLVGWDEILEGGLAPNATVMSWRGTAGGIEAARAGHDVVMAPVSHTYLDYYQSRDTATEPIAIGGFLPLETVYSFDPLPAGLEPAFAKHILGAQVQVWTEYMKNPKKVEYMAFPRLTALAEVVWTPNERKDYADYRARLDAHLSRLAALDVNARPPEPAGGR